MIAHELHTGLLFEAGGRTVATVDTSRGFLELRSRRGRTRTYAASIAGVRVATEPECAIDEQAAALGCEPVKRLFEEHGLMTCCR